MDLTDNINKTQAIALASNIRSVRYEDLTPDQRQQMETSLGHFDYFQGYNESDSEAEKAKKFNTAVQSFVADNHLDGLDPFQQFLTILFSFLESNGTDLNQTFGALRHLPFVGKAIDSALANSPSHHWNRSNSPAPGQSVDLPATGQIPQGALGAIVPVPPSATAGHDGRYRLVTVATGSQGNKTGTEMVVMNPQGEVVWRSAMNSGSGNARSLPGLRTAFDGQAVTTEYRLDWNDVRLNRQDRLGMTGMSLSDGSPGFSFTLENPSNMAQLGGAGRNDFRIHPGGRNVGTAGCLEFLDSHGGISRESDRNARSFAALMTSIPPDQRPISLEILNPKMIGQQIEISRARPAPSAPAVAARSPVQSDTSAASAPAAPAAPSAVVANAGDIAASGA